LVRSVHRFKSIGSAATIEHVLALAPEKLLGGIYCVADSSRCEFHRRACAGRGWAVSSTPLSCITTNCRANDITAAPHRFFRAADIDTPEAISHPEHTFGCERQHFSGRPWRETWRNV
jgi:hypothetical protein